VGEVCACDVAMSPTSLGLMVASPNKGVLYCSPGVVAGKSEKSPPSIPSPLLLVLKPEASRDCEKSPCPWGLNVLKDVLSVRAWFG
jgi:hypothetical protein